MFPALRFVVEKVAPVQVFLLVRRLYLSLSFHQLPVLKVKGKVYPRIGQEGLEAE